MFSMFKKQYLLSIVSFLSIPAVVLLGSLVFNAIDPEIAARFPNYERNYRLLSLAKNLSLLAALLASASLWFLTCFFLVKSKGRSSGLLPLAMLGPFGFIVLTMLNDNAPMPGDRHQQFMSKLKRFQRVALELCVFVVVWGAADQIVVMKRNFMIWYESATTGISTVQIIARQNASSGMWAFSEGMEVMFLVVLLYLLWPIAFNAVSRLSKVWASKS